MKDRDKIPFGNVLWTNNFMSQSTNDAITLNNGENEDRKAQDTQIDSLDEHIRKKNTFWNKKNKEILQRKC